MEQTAVEFLENIYLTTGIDRNVHFSQAKVIEKQQIIDARLTAPLINSPFESDYREEAEQYYKETFKNKL